MRRKQHLARVELGENAAGRPHVGWIAPLEAENHLGRAVLPRIHNLGVVLVVERGAAKVNEADLGMFGHAVLRPPAVGHGFRGDEKDVFRL